VDAYVLSYTRDAPENLLFPRFPGDGNAVAGKTGKKKRFCAAIFVVAKNVTIHWASQWH
jgi:hypothetical protein